MDDSISRKAAVEELNRLRANWNNADRAVDKCISTIKDMPSVQPEIIRCKDCKYHRKEIGWHGVEFMVCDLSGINKPIRKDDDFCSRAERREE